MTKIIFEKDLPLKEKTVCTIGNFDGVHKGHAEILKKLKEDAKIINAKSVVITFYPHPRNVIYKDKKICAITNLKTKLELIKNFDIDYILIIEFRKQFYQQTAKQFMEFLKQNLNPAKIVIGEDWRFGYKKEGDIEFAKKYFDLDIVKPILTDNHKISSSQIRGYLSEGDIEKAVELLGHEYFIIEEVIKGNNIGSKIGFPTINLKAETELCLKKGVYAGYSIINGNKYKSVINYGYRPTVDGKNLIMEAHIIEDYNIEKLPKEIAIQFEKFIREEKKFKNLEELKEQISEDIKTAKNILEKKDALVK